MIVPESLRCWVGRVNLHGIDRLRHGVGDSVCRLIRQWPSCASFTNIPLEGSEGKRALHDKVKTSTPVQCFVACVYIRSIFTLSQPLQQPLHFFFHIHCTSSFYTLRPSTIPLSETAHHEASIASCCCPSTWASALQAYRASVFRRPRPRHRHELDNRSRI